MGKGMEEEEAGDEDRAEEGDVDNKHCNRNSNQQQITMDSNTQDHLLSIIIISTANSIIL